MHFAREILSVKIILFIGEISCSLEVAQAVAADNRRTAVPPKAQLGILRLRPTRKLSQKFIPCSDKSSYLIFGYPQKLFNAFIHFVLLYVC